MVKVYYNFRNHESDNGFIPYLETLPSEVKYRVMKYVKRQDQCNAVIGKKLLEIGLSDFGLKHQLSLQYNDYGKPFIDLPIDFTTSHADHLIVCAISNEGPIGIDVERIHNITFENFITHFSVEEWNDIQWSNNACEKFFQLWTSKEAVLKAEGVGIKDYLNTVNVTGEYAIHNDMKWYLQQVKVNPLYIVTVATTKEICVDCCNEIYLSLLDDNHSL